MYQAVVEHLIYPCLTRLRGSRELALLRELRQSERLRPELLHELRLGRLRRVLEHAAAHVPFYRQRFGEAGFSGTTVKDFTDLRRIPILTKADIQSNREQMFSDAFDRNRLIENRTGGSTGSPLVFYHERERWEERQAATFRHNGWAGFRIGDKMALIWGHQTDLSALQSLRARMRNALIDRQLICDSSSFDEQKLQAFAKAFQRFRPRVILAYANSLAHVVDFMKAQKIALPPPKSIITSAEVLTTETRALIENYFGTKVFDRYGSRETSVIASECTAHDGLHIGAEYLHLEFVANDRDVSAGESGEIIVTVLGNLAFPLIRYQIGDMGSPATPSDCPCGVTLPKMQMVAGRVTDFLLAPDGRRVSGAAMTIYLAAKVPGVRQAQIVQRELRRLIFRLVVDSSFDQKSRDLIADKVRHFFGAAVQIEYQFVDQIPKESSGKYRFSICEIGTA